jgi:linoleoyl-CoA desaturase
MKGNKSQTLQPVRFGKDPEFIKELRKRVRGYFQENDVKMQGDWRMYIKSAFMLLLYFTPFVLMLTGVATGYGMVMLMFVIMGIGISGIGLGIMHDANHGAYSTKKWVNRMMGNTLNLVGGYAPTWRFQHNVLHHTYTNIEGMDEDIDPGGVMRFSPHAERKYMHRFQWFYAWFFYGLMTFFWVTFKDFAQINRYAKKGILNAEGKSKKSMMWETVIWKAFYYTYFFTLLILLTDIPIWYLLVGFFVMHFVAGLILGMIFQPAHVMTETHFPLPDEQNTLENAFAVHQMLTTANFARNNRVLSWFVGGLNYQVEHHLFPYVCHIHYRKIAPIVKATAEEYGLPYYEQKTFVGALWNHTKMLYRLGRIESSAYKPNYVYKPA